MNVIFRPLAVEDTVETAAWYEERAPGLGGELSVRLDRMK